MRWVSEVGQFLSQDFYLFVDEDSNPCDVSVFMKKADLIVAQTKTARIPIELRVEYRPDGIMKSRKVVHKVECIIRHTAASTPCAQALLLSGQLAINLVPCGKCASASVSRRAICDSDA